MVFDPFLVIAITLCIGLIIGPARAAPARRATGAALTGAYLLAVLWQLRLHVPGDGRQDHPVRDLVLPHVVPRLDLTCGFSARGAAHPAGNLSVG